MWRSMWAIFSYTGEWPRGLGVDMTGYQREDWRYRGWHAPASYSQCTSFSRTGGPLRCRSNQRIHNIQHITDSISTDTHIHSPITTSYHTTSHRYHSTTCMLLGLGLRIRTNDGWLPSKPKPAEGDCCCCKCCCS